jgi:hypothetical protein
MKVRELVELLDQLPPDAEVTIVKRSGLLMLDPPTDHPVTCVERITVSSLGGTIKPVRTTARLT